MKRATAFTVLLLALLTFGCLGCVLTLTDYFAPAFSQSEGSAVLNIETYIDGQNQPTHPAVIDMKREWNGYRYWMSYSPYPNADGAEENPCIGVSNDMIHWTTPDGLYNPIAFNEETACDELKDPHIVYNNDLNRMEIWYLGRTDSTIKSGGTLLLFRKVSSDGVHWSEYEIMRDLVGYLSPSIVYSEGKYKLWAIEPSTSGREGALAYSESTDGDTWTPFEKCTFGGYYGIEKIWHGAVSLDDTYRFAFIEDSGKSNTILYTESHDGITWERPVPIVRKENFWKAFYRPCILYSDGRLYCIDEPQMIYNIQENSLSQSAADSEVAIEKFMKNCAGYRDIRYHLIGQVINDPVEVQKYRLLADIAYYKLAFNEAIKLKSKKTARTVYADLRRVHACTINDMIGYCSLFCPYMVFPLRCIRKIKTAIDTLRETL